MESIIEIQPGRENPCSLLNKVKKFDDKKIVPGALENSLENSITVTGQARRLFPR